MDLELSEEGEIRSEQKLVGGTLRGDTEATIARDTFEGILEVLSRMKESIGRVPDHRNCKTFNLVLLHSLAQNLRFKTSFPTASSFHQ